MSSLYYYPGSRSRPPTYYQKKGMIHSRARPFSDGKLPTHDDLQRQAEYLQENGFIPHPPSSVWHYECSWAEQRISSSSVVTVQLNESTIVPVVCSAYSISPSSIEFLIVDSFYFIGNYCPNLTYTWYFEN